MRETPILTAEFVDVECQGDKTRITEADFKPSKFNPRRGSDLSLKLERLTRCEDISGSY